MPVSADVGDNLNGWLINFLGYGKESSVPADYGGSLIERMNYLEKQQQNLVTKEQIKDLATKEDVENFSKAANASYNLYVYIPKDEATGNYDGQKVTITSSSGNQNSTATLRDDGKNYSARLYFDFNGSCKLKFNMIYNSATNEVQLPVSISTTGQEQKLWEKGRFTNQYSWEFIHEICSNNQAGRFFNVGDAISGNWYIINNQGASLQIWRKANVTGKDVFGNDTDYMPWDTANSTANSYWQTFNNVNNTNVAYSSGLLSYNELNSGWLANNRTTGSEYWSATPYGDAVHWSVLHNGNLHNNSSNYSNHVCCPSVWIH